MGRTSLHRASERGHVDLARFLIEHGADAAAQDEDWTTPLHWASKQGRVDILVVELEQHLTHLSRV